MSNRFHIENNVFKREAKQSIRKSWSVETLHLIFYDDFPLPVGTDCVKRNGKGEKKKEKQSNEKGKMW